MTSCKYFRNCRTKQVQRTLTFDMIKQITRTSLEAAGQCFTNSHQSQPHSFENHCFISLLTVSCELVKYKTEIQSAWVTRQEEVKGPWLWSLTSVNIVLVQQKTLHRKQFSESREPWIFCRWPFYRIRSDLILEHGIILSTRPGLIY